MNTLLMIAIGAIALAAGYFIGFARGKKAGAKWLEEAKALTTSADGQCCSISMNLSRARQDNENQSIRTIL